jgi:hypothetical protein
MSYKSPPPPYTAPKKRNRGANKVSDAALAAANRMEAMGGSPRIQLTAAKVSSGQPNLTYMPHCGAKERARNLARMVKAAEHAS